MKTTLNKIREQEPCSGGWSKLLKALNKTKADDEELPLLTVLDSNGIEDALWCLRAVDGYDREKRLYAVWCASQVKHLMTDRRSLNALKVAKDFAEGKATVKQLDTARVAAQCAAADAVVHTAAIHTAAARAAATATVYTAAARAALSASIRTARCAVIRAAAYADQEGELRRMLNCIENKEEYTLQEGVK